MAKILILGGLGVIGQIISKKLYGHDIIIGDIEPKTKNKDNAYLQIDITNYEELIRNVPDDIDVLINLVGLNEKPKIVTPEDFQKMSNIYINGSYNAYYLALKKNIKKIIFASTNHVTDSFENDGYSLINKEIQSSDAVSSFSVYGNMKYFAENLGKIFSDKYGLQIYCIRYGTVRSSDSETFNLNDRAKRTGLLHKDLLFMISKMIDDNEIKYGIYYGVSENENKPWDTQNFKIDFKINY